MDRERVKLKRLPTHLTGQLLILLHEFLVLLVDSQHLADPIGSRLGLGHKTRGQGGCPGWTSKGKGYVEWWSVRKPQTITNTSESHTPYINSQSVLG
jgi:hypothetical protein